MVGHLQAMAAEAPGDVCQKHRTRTYPTRQDAAAERDRLDAQATADGTPHRPRKIAPCNAGPGWHLQKVGRPRTTEEPAP